MLCEYLRGLYGGTECDNKGITAEQTSAEKEKTYV